jgi:phosphosulfolactate synthase
MWECPDFLEVPERESKPRARGLTHVLDKGMPLPALEALLNQVGDLIDVVKVGWGIAYVDRMLKERAVQCRAAGTLICLGGTLLEVAVVQGKLDGLRRWTLEQGIDALEVSNGLGWLGGERKAALVRQLAEDFTVLAETGAKDDTAAVIPEQWAAEMEADLAAGAQWVIAEGREGGNVGLFQRDGSVRRDLVDLIAERLPLERVIFEAPQKAQQAWFVRHLGPDVNLGNVPPDEVLPLETLRLGLRADTARVRPAR